MHILTHLSNTSTLRTQKVISHDMCTSITNFPGISSLAILLQYLVGIFIISLNLKHVSRDEIMACVIALMIGFLPLYELHVCDLE